MASYSLPTLGKSPFLRSTAKIYLCAFSPAIAVILTLPLRDILPFFPSISQILLLTPFAHTIKDFFSVLPRTLLICFHCLFLQCSYPLHLNCKQTKGLAHSLSHHFIPSCSLDASGIWSFWWHQFPQLVPSVYLTSEWEINIWTGKSRDMWLIYNVQLLICWLCVHHSAKQRAARPLCFAK